MELRKELTAIAHRLVREQRAQFTSDPDVRKRARQFLTVKLPPKPRRRGRPGIASVTTLFCALCQMHTLSAT
jgi:hypothetical protein